MLRVVGRNFLLLRGQRRGFAFTKSKKENDKVKKKVAKKIERVIFSSPHHRRKS